MKRIYEGPDEEYFWENHLERLVSDSRFNAIKVMDQTIGDYRLKVYSSLNINNPLALIYSNKGEVGNEMTGIYLLETTGTIERFLLEEYRRVVPNKESRAPLTEEDISHELA